MRSAQGWGDGGEASGTGGAAPAGWEMGAGKLGAQRREVEMGAEEGAGLCELEARRRRGGERAPPPMSPEKFVPWLARPKAEGAGPGDTRQVPGAERGGRTSPSEPPRLSGIPARFASTRRNRRQHAGDPSVLPRQR